MFCITLSNSSRLVMDKYCSFTNVSKLTFTELIPAFLNVSIKSFTKTPLVVMVNLIGYFDNFSMISLASFLTNGSPPVKRILLTPFLIKTAAMLSISAADMYFELVDFPIGKYSAVQYSQRKLHLSVSEILK